MDKIVIGCKGEIENAFGNKEDNFLGYLWDNEMEVTWCNVEKTDDDISEVTIFGFEESEGVIRHILDKRTKDNAEKKLSCMGVEVIGIKHFIIDDSEYIYKKREVDGREDEE